MSDSKQVHELKDLEVDRVDGVDKPATSRNFLLFKSKGALDVARKAAKSVFKDLFAPLQREFPIESQPTRTGPRLADEGEDTLGRAYSDEVYATLGGMNGIVEDVTTAPEYLATPGFSRGDKGESVKPRQDYRYVEPTAVVRVGPNFVLPSQTSGIADAEDFKAPQPVTVVKDARLGKGLFTDVTVGPMPAGSNPSNFFDTPRVTKSEKKLGEGMFSDIVGD